MGRAEVQAGLPAPPGGIWRPCRRAQVKALWKGPSARGGEFWRGGHLGWGPPPASTRLHPLAPPGGSGDALNRKKKNCLPGRGPASQPPRLRRAAARENNCSLLPASCPRSLLPGRSGAQPGRGRRGAGRPPGLPPLAPPLRLDLLRPPSACLRLGLRRPPARFVARLLPGRWKFLGSPQSSLHLLASPGPLPAPAVPSLRSRSCSSPSRPFLPSPGAPGLLPASGAGIIAPARARPPGPVAPDARAPRGCWLPGP